MGKVDGSLLETDKQTTVLKDNNCLNRTVWYGRVFGIGEVEKFYSRQW